MKTIPIRTYLSITTFLILFSTLATAQQRRGPMQDRIRQLESRKVAFITSELSLTPEEAQVFWPVYNEYNTRRHQMMMRFRNERTDAASIDEMSEAELTEVADNEVTSMEEMARLRRQYHERFKEILPIKKVVQLYNAERGFNRQLLRDGRGPGQGMGRGRN